jgi:hypothetical protein
MLLLFLFIFEKAAQYTVRSPASLITSRQQKGVKILYLTRHYAKVGLYHGLNSYKDTKS